MAYTPPVGVADLALTGSYTPPVGTVNLDIGTTTTPDRSCGIAGETLAPTGTVAVLSGRVLVAAGETLAPTGTVTVFSGRVATVAGETLAPTGSIQLQKTILVAVVGETLAPTGRLDSSWDANLLSAVHAVMDSAWQDGQNEQQGIQEAIEDAPGLMVGGNCSWQEAALLSDSKRSEWKDSYHLDNAGIDCWQDADDLSTTVIDGWQQAPRLELKTSDRWQDAVEPLTIPVISRFMIRTPLMVHDGIPVWQNGTNLNHHIQDGMQDGLRLAAVEVEVWQQAGYPGNAQNPGPSIPPIIPYPWGTDLQLRCPLPGTTLRIGRSPCVLFAEREIPFRRSYMTTNTASLVRWPDLIPLPVTSMTVETDFESWCWSLTATLAGPDAWALVQPNPLACEVQATINGQVWRFLLDVPSINRKFNENRVTLKGRSRSAWLHSPYTTASVWDEDEAREMVQLAEAAIANTGWTLDWQTSNWLVPAGRYHSTNTPMGALIRLANVTNDGIYTDPTLQIISLLPRWPVASWLVDGETADIAIPEAAILNLTQSPVYSQPYNGVYVSGTTHGALALVKITGTDGALQPVEPVTDELLCDAAGVAARARGLNVLSDAGAGWEMDAVTLFAPSATPAFPLVPPGRIVTIGGMKGVSRSVQITAQRSNGALSVRQTIGLERREVES